ncbi:sensor histidine kinase [Cohnella sp.]|uniref:sensor histidine kinase n=1 Tax=Cohnella sp. TaxID=1883426 RepID=UPI003564E07F
MTNPLGRLTHISWKSLRIKLIAGVVLLVAPLIGLLIYSNFYAVEVVRNQVAESNKNLMSMYMDQFDRSLQNADDYLLGLIGTGSGLEELDSATDFERYSAVRRLSVSATGMLPSLQPVDGIFIYSVSRDEYIPAHSSRTTIDERQAVRSYVEATTARGLTAKELFHRGWDVRQIESSHYLIRLMRSDSVYLGAWMNIDRADIPLDFIHTGTEGAVLFADLDGAPLTNEEFVGRTGVRIEEELGHYYLTGKRDRFLAVGDRSSKGSFSLIAFIPEGKILEKLPQLQRLVALITLGAIPLLPLCLYLLRKVLLVPLNRLLQAMKRIGEGNLDTRIPQFRTSEELAAVRDTFNAMMSQIRELRISVYEEKLSKQKAELQHLQLQLNPHFFINSLNMVHMLARTKNNALAEEISLCLVHYFRYMLRSDLHFVTLGEELLHIRNYVRIQELRYPEDFRCELRVPDFLLRTAIPPLLLHTFVENTVKHALTLDEPTLLSVAVDLEAREDEKEEWIHIAIQDNGPGFRREALEEINRGNRVVDQEGEHIGLWNASRRLQLLYGRKASIRYGNAMPHGAIVEIRLPLRPAAGNLED